MTFMATQQSYAPAAKKMKLEHDGAATTGTPQPQSSTPAPTAPTYSTTAQWSTQIPIDPALQQQPATPHAMMPYQYAYGTSHYPQAGYPTHTHYAQYQAAQPPTASAAAPPLSRQATQQGDVDTTDVATLNDALGSAGVDIRAEEETLQRSQDHHITYRTHEDRSRKQPQTPAFDARIVGATMRGIGTRHKVGTVPEDAVNYVALALRTRLQGLIEAMVNAAEHRATTQFDRTPSSYEDGTPTWSVIVRRDTKKQLEALERAEREEEMRVRRERRERADAAAAQAANAAAQAAGSPGLDGVGGGGGIGGDDPMDGLPAKKPKKKKDGPGVTAKNMSEDVQKRLSNAVATQAAGLGRGKYAWMNAGSVTPALKAAKSAAPTTPAPGGAAGASSVQATQSPVAGQPGNGVTWAKPYVSASTKPSASPAPGEEEKMTVTMRDAMFVIERERGHGAGRGAARGWV